MTDVYFFKKPKSVLSNFPRRRVDCKCCKSVDLPWQKIVGTEKVVAPPYKTLLSTPHPGRQGVGGGGGEIKCNSRSLYLRIDSSTALIMEDKELCCSSASAVLFLIFCKIGKYTSKSPNVVRPINLERPSIIAQRVRLRACWIYRIPV